METFSAEKEEEWGERVSLSDSSSRVDDLCGFTVNEDRIANCCDAFHH